jgi:hypothetical protein
MRLPPNEPAIETPLVLLILILVVAPLTFFGVRHEMRVRAESRAQAKREATYQAALRSYTQILKPGMKRGEVEDYLSAKKVQFLRLSLDDLTPIGKDEPANWFCGKPDVYVRFQFTAPSQHEDRPAEANQQDTLEEIKISRLASSCI